MMPTPVCIGQRRLVLAIAGRKSSSPRYSDEIANAAYAAGCSAAEAGLTVLTGGLSGVMERAAEGAKQAGGTTIGILPGSHHDEGNPFLDYVLPSGLGIARNYLIANACDLMIALPGGTGTLEEICFALDFKRPVISWGSWDIDGVHKVPFPDEAALRKTLATLVSSLVATNTAK